MGSDCRSRPREQTATICSLRFRSTLSTVTGTPRIFVSNGTARCSSIIVNQPVTCSDSSWQSTVASSIIASSLALLIRGFIDVLRLVFRQEVSCEVVQLLERAQDVLVVLDDDLVSGSA